MRGRGDLGARQLSDKLHEDGRDGRAEWEDQVMVVMVMVVMVEINYMKMVEMDGLSGKIRSTMSRYNWHYAISWSLRIRRKQYHRFDGSGFRTNFTLEIVELKREGLEKVPRSHSHHVIIHRQTRWLVL